MPQPDPVPPPRPLHRLLHIVRTVLGMSQAELGAQVQLSRRTIIRWERKQASPAPFHTEHLAALVREVDEGLADELLLASGLPLPEPPPPPPPAPPPPPTAADIEAVVYAAADAADLAPRATRAALLSALRRARELGVDAAALEQALATPSPGPGSSPRP